MYEITDIIRIESQTDGGELFREIREWRND